eukprot:999924_1
MKHRLLVAQNTCKTMIREKVRCEKFYLRSRERVQELENEVSQLKNKENTADEMNDVSGNGELLLDGHVELASRNRELEELVDAFSTQNRIYAEALQEHHEVTEHLLQEMNL